jgi:hypothetical protein
MINLNKIPEVVALSEIFRRHDITLRTYQMNDMIEGRKIRSFHCEFAQSDDRKPDKIEKVFRTIAESFATASGYVQNLENMQGEAKFDVCFATDRERADFLMRLGKTIVQTENTPVLAKSGSGLRIGR